MRKIEILEDVRIRFPARGPEFDLGVEIGVLSVLMAQGERRIERHLPRESLEQIRPLAKRFHYTVIATAHGADFAITLVLGKPRPSLRIVS